jgi:hypothetical protein
MSKKQPIDNPLLFNGLAIVFLLLILPVAIAYTTDIQGEYDPNDYESSTKEWSIGTPPHMIWSKNGQDLTQEYAIQEADTLSNLECAYYLPNMDQTQISPFFTDWRIYGSSCYGDGDVLGSDAYTGFGVGHTNYWSYYFGNIGIKSAQTHHHINDLGLLNHGYIGQSGDQDFSWIFNAGKNTSSNKFFIPNGEIFAFRIMQVDEYASYACDDYRFSELSLDYKLIMYYENETIEFEYNVIQDNYKVNNLGTCNAFLEFDFEFSSLDLAVIENFNSNDWNSTVLEFEIEKVKRTDNTQFGSTFLPFAGVNEYITTFEYVSDPQIDITTGLNVVSGLLGGVMIILALASTTYWNPVVDRFKRFEV